MLASRRIGLVPCCMQLAELFVEKEVYGKSQTVSYAMYILGMYFLGIYFLGMYFLGVYFLGVYSLAMYFLGMYFLRCVDTAPRLGLRMATKLASIR